MLAHLHLGLPLDLLHLKRQLLLDTRHLLLALLRDRQLLGSVGVLRRDTGISGQSEVGPSPLPCLFCPNSGWGSSLEMPFSQHPKH